MTKAKSRAKEIAADNAFQKEVQAIIHEVMIVLAKENAPDYVTMYALCAIMLALHGQTHGSTTASVDRLVTLVGITLHSMSFERVQ